ncbi:MAG TPA: FAD-dependent oxidoreductase [Gaiellaceae bacterium]|nr:FAD-dependent oxidoreductase [Gaiellaceae bacterium]
MGIATAGVDLRARSGGPTRADVVIVGAGPYGLAAAAHLKAAGLKTRVFGETMASWQHHMPAGMLLRSRPRASYLADPAHELGLDRYEAELGLEHADPVPLERFVAYGHWFQERAVPDLDRRRVVRIDADGGAFTVELDDGEELRAGRAVVAAGILPFARRPSLFEDLPRELVSHAADHSDLGVFRGRRVVVVGAGQSALESAALLAENGAEPEVLARRDDIRWLAEGGDVNAGSLRYYAYRRTALGGPRSSWLIAWPALWRRLPFDRRERLAYRAIGPAGAGWLRPRLTQVPITTSESILAASEHGGRVRLHLAGGAVREADHVLLATGYEVDITRYDFLAPSLLHAVRRHGGFPILGPGFESSLPGLHFVGATSTHSLGPVMRFVCGTWAAARGLTRGIVGRGVPRAGFSW